MLYLQHGRHDIKCKPSIAGLQIVGLATLLIGKYIIKVVYKNDLDTGFNLSISYFLFERFQVRCDRLTLRFDFLTRCMML